MQSLVQRCVQILIFGLERVNLHQLPVGVIHAESFLFLVSAWKPTLNNGGCVHLVELFSMPAMPCLTAPGQAEPRLAEPRLACRVLSNMKHSVASVFLRSPFAHSDCKASGVEQVNDLLATQYIAVVSDNELC